MMGRSWAVARLGWEPRFLFIAAFKGSGRWHAGCSMAGGGGACRWGWRGGGGGGAARGPGGRGRGGWGGAAGDGLCRNSGGGEPAGRLKAASRRRSLALALVLAV